METTLAAVKQYRPGVGSPYGVGSGFKATTYGFFSGTARVRNSAYGAYIVNGAYIYWQCSGGSYRANASFPMAPNWVVTFVADAGSYLDDTSIGVFFPIY